MHPKDIKVIQATFIAPLLILITASFLHSPGTNDVGIRMRWAENADTYGVVAGFAANKADYPPLTSVILLCAVRASRSLGISAFDAVKLSIFLFLVLTSFVFWLWTKNFLVTTMLYLSLLLNSVALVYTDVYFAPALILSMKAIKERKLAWFTTFFSVACLTKWQPIILAPFIAVYILDIKQITLWRQIDFKKISRSGLLPAIAILFLTLLVFGTVPVLMSLARALNHGFLSGNALNFNWILTHLLHTFYPEKFGGLIDGQAGYIITKSLKVTLTSKILFFLTYAGTIVSFFKRDKTFENFINYSLIGYLAYFFFNTGVHENHLFLATIISIVLFWTNKNHLPLAIIMILISNINLLVFYGIDGTGLGFSRVTGIDIALPLSIYNTSIFLILWVINVFHGFKSRTYNSRQIKNI
jgi:hypothetical protein